MTKLYLYTVFHGNLAFSSIPEEHYGRVIDRCFWPIVDLLSRYPEIKLGFEFPSYTMDIIDREDPMLTRTLSDYWNEGRCEIIGSGYCQTIFPLIPASVNARNLTLGNAYYLAFFDRLPVTAYVNEQTYSSGILQLYLSNGYRNLIMDWENIASSHAYPENMRYGAQWAVGQDGARMAVIWNSTIAFQKFQRYVQGEMNLEEYTGYLQSQYSETEDRAFLLYGSDWEIFDYRPGDPDIGYSRGTGEEMKRIISLFDYLVSDPRFELVTPDEAVGLLPARHEIRLESAEYPIPCKKQEKYNVTRWAACGRDNIRLNTQCFQLLRNINWMESLAKFTGDEQAEGKIEALYRDLVYLWGSDFRTYTTDEKFLAFRNKMGIARSQSEEAISALTDQLQVEKDFALFNPGRADWNGSPFVLTAHFPPGAMQGHIRVRLNGQEVPTQEEDIENYRDGSRRQVTLVIKPFLPAGTLSQGELTASPEPEAPPSDVLIGESSVATPAVEANFNRLRGGALKELAFPRIAERVLVRTTPHGYFTNIELAADFYSANMTAINRASGEKITDLSKTDLIFPETVDSFPIRVPVRCRIMSPLGPLWKTFYIYRQEPRVDIRYHFRLRDFRPLYFRLGMLTINPEAFDHDTLRYASVNGGYLPETFKLKGKRVEQDEAVSLSVSAHHCLGATEGWTDISDDEKGVAVITNRSQMYSVPLLHYEEDDGKYFLRIYTSIGEADDTCDIFWRGHNKIDVTFLGHGKGLDDVRRESERINQGLVVIWRK
jgi:hypothetical protein